MTPIKVHNITMGDMGGMGGIRCYGWYSVLWVVFGAMGGIRCYGWYGWYGWYSVLWVVFGAMGGIRCDNVKSGQKYENLL